MKRLNRDYWRLAWVLLTNGIVIFFFVSGPVKAHHDQQLLYQVMRTSPPPFSYLHEFFSGFWGPFLVFTLLGGILAEVWRSVLSPVFNLGPFVAWFIGGLWERTKVANEATPYELFLGKIFLVVLAVVIAVDLLFYVIAFRRRQTEGGDLGTTSRTGSAAR